MSESWNPFWSGFLLGIILFILILNLPFTTISVARKAIEECERNLSRTQHCKISAIPEPPA